MTAVVVGSGEYTYDVVQDHAKLPAGRSFGMVCGVAVDSQDRLYVYHRGQHPVAVFDCDGTFLQAWGDGLTDDAHHIFIDSQDLVYLVDRDSQQVFKCTTDGDLLLTLGQKHHASLQAPFNHPASAAVGPNGEIYISDGYANSRVYKFSPDGELMHAWGSPGSRPGEFRVPHGIWVDAEGLVYVADRENSRVQVFSPEGELASVWGDVFMPTDVHVDRNGIAYVTELLTFRFSIMDREGRLLARGRTQDQSHAIWVDSHRDFYVAPAFGRFTVDKYVRRTVAPTRND